MMAEGAVVGASGSETILETGLGSALQRRTVPLAVPLQYPSAAVQFDLVFATDERLFPGEFLDSFTVSLRRTDRSAIAVALTADPFGVTWLPESPGALVLAPEDLLFEAGEPFVGGAVFRFQTRYSVLVELPEVMRSEPVELVLTLVDNMDEEASRATVDNVRVKLGLQARIALESSADATGAFAEEPGVQVNRLRQTLTVTKAGANRFFRLRGESSSQIERLDRSGQDWVIRYQAELGAPVLELFGADEPDGPFHPVSNAQFDLNGRTVSVPLFNAPAFFRMGGSHPARIIADEVTGNQRVLGFEVRPRSPRVESSAQLGGPYGLESGVEADPFAQTLTLPGGGAARYYRVSAAVPLVLGEVTRTDSLIVIRYEEP